MVMEQSPRNVLSARHGYIKQLITKSFLTLTFCMQLIKRCSESTLLLLCFCSDPFI